MKCMALPLVVLKFRDIVRCLFVYSHRPLYFYSCEMLMFTSRHARIA